MTFGSFLVILTLRPKRCCPQLYLSVPYFIRTTFATAFLLWILNHHQLQTRSFICMKWISTSLDVSTLEYLELYVFEHNCIRRGMSKNLLPGSAFFGSILIFSNIMHTTTRLSGHSPLHSKSFYLHPYESLMVHVNSRHL